MKVQMQMPMHPIVMNVNGQILILMLMLMQLMQRTSFGIGF